MSEGFTENSVRNSKGSVNPYINWKDIAKYEFLLPPKDEQAKLAKLLCSMDEALEKNKSLLNKYNTFYERYLADSVSGKLSNLSDDWKEYVFGDLGETFNGLNGKSKNAEICKSSG